MVVDGDDCGGGSTNEEMMGLCGDWDGDSVDDRYSGVDGRR